MLTRDAMPVLMRHAAPAMPGVYAFATRGARERRAMPRLYDIVYARAALLSALLRAMVDIHVNRTAETAPTPRDVTQHMLLPCHADADAAHHAPRP